MAVAGESFRDYLKNFEGEKVVIEYEYGNCCKKISGGIIRCIGADFIFIEAKGKHRYNEKFEKQQTDKYKEKYDDKSDDRADKCEDDHFDKKDFIAVFNSCDCDVPSEYSEKAIIKLRNIIAVESIKHINNSCECD